MSRTGIKRSHERFKQEYACKDRREYACEEQNDRKARKDTKVSFPPGKLATLLLTTVLRPPTLDAEGASASPPDG